jgi:N-sulfoglucosamine sulfohydrolase
MTKKKFTIPEYMVDNEKTRNDLKLYYAEITYTHSLLGVCLDYLEEKGKLENTIIIFTSEQGSSFPMAKWTCYDLGLKTAFIVKWSGKVKPGSRSNAQTQYIDVVPTLLQAAGASSDGYNTGVEDANGNKGFDGRSFLNVLLGNNMEDHEYVFGLQTTRGIFSGSVCYPIRSVRSKQYKYILNLNSSSSFLNMVSASSGEIYQNWIKATENDPEMRYYIMRYTRRPKEELYDVENDPYEINNLAENPEFDSVKSSLIKELGHWMKVQGDEGIGTEMNALNRMPRNLDGNWQGYENQENKRILNYPQ